MKCDGIFPFCGWGKTQTLESIVDDTENKGGGGDLEIVRILSHLTFPDGKNPWRCHLSCGYTKCVKS